MPQIHNPDWNSLKLSDFPQFKCMCELCDCGCFDRSKKKHSLQCPNKRKFISQSFDSPFDGPRFDSTSLYADTFRKFNWEKHDPVAHDEKHANDPNVVQDRNKNLKIEIPFKHGPKGGSIELPGENMKFSKNTTNKEHFKKWNSGAAKIIPEYPEFTSGLMYPNNKRHYLTTNEEMYYKNYGKFTAEASGFNIFENTFNIHNGKMDLRTVQKLDYPKLNVRQVLMDRGPIVTKEMVEKRGQRILNKLPMDLTSSNRADYAFDIDTFREASKKNETIDLFKSKLNDGMNPPEADYVPLTHNFETNYVLSFRDKTNESVEENKRSSSTELAAKKFGDSHLSHNRNIRFANAFDNRLIPSLKVLKTIVPPIKKGSSRQSVRGSVNLVEEEEIPLKTIYNIDFKERGFGVCMAKAYGKVLNAQNQQSNLNNSIDISG